MSDPTNQHDELAPRPGRRTASGARRRVDVFSVVAVVVPVITIALALLVDVEPEPVGAVPPTQTRLTRSTVICPGAGPEAYVSTLSGEQGTVEAQAGDETGDLDVRGGQAASLEPGGRQALVLTGRGQLAPGLLAARFDSPLAAADCGPPDVDVWFTGVGAGARHSSMIELTNPDAGRAVVDIEVRGRDGLVDAPELRGLAVPGGQTVRVDLAETIPRRDDLALHVQTTRGRVAADVLDTFDTLGAGPGGSDWLPAQTEPAARNLLLGLPGGGGQRVLVLSNPGDDEARAGVQVVSQRSVFSPEGLDDVVVPAQSTVRVRLSKALRESVNDDEVPVGVRIDSTEPVTSGLRLSVGADLVQSTPLSAVESDETGATPLPDGDKQLVLGGASSTAVVDVEAWDSDGNPLDLDADVARAEVGADRASVVDLPGEARLVAVTPSQTSVQAVVEVSGADAGGATLVRVRQPQTTGLVAQVRPGLPGE